MLDELGFIPFASGGVQLLFQYITNLYERVAVIVTTNLRFAEWSSVLGGDERLAAALLDRLTHRAHILEFVGTSYRFREQLSREGVGSSSSTASLEQKQEGLEVETAPVPPGVNEGQAQIEKEAEAPLK